MMEPDPEELRTDIEKHPKIEPDEIEKPPVEAQVPAIIEPVVEKAEQVTIKGPRRLLASKKQTRHDLVFQKMRDRVKAMGSGLLDRVLEEAVESGPSRTEPAKLAIERAEQIRRERETDYDRANLKEHQVEGYTHSIAEEAYARILSLDLQYFEIGRILFDAKSVLPHGDFLDYISKYFPDRSYSHFQNCINVYEVCMGCPEVLQFLKRSLWYEICSPKFPQDFRQFILDNATGIYPIKHRELINIMRKYRDGEITITSPEIQGLLTKRKDRKAADFAIKELRFARLALEKHLKVLEQFARESHAEPILTDSESARSHRHYTESISLLKECIARLHDKIKALTNLGHMKV